MVRWLKFLGVAVAMVALNVATVLIVLDKVGVTEAGTGAESGGDANGDGDVSITDALYILEYLFLMGPEPEACAGSSNFTDDEIEFLQELATRADFVSISDGEEEVLPTLRFSGINLQIVNGTGATNGLSSDPESLDDAETVVNGTGNLIIGYNEVDGLNPIVDDRTGSHNLVLGQYNSYSQYGGIFAGRGNTQTTAYSSIFGGEFNQANGVFSSVVGGAYNVADGRSSVIVGGGSESEVDGNVTTADYSVIVAGRGNVTLGSASTIVGGQENETTGTSAVIVGGFTNFTDAEQTVVVGGTLNIAGAFRSVITGGEANSTAGAGDLSVVSGGQTRAATGEYDWVAGELTEDD